MKIEICLMLDERSQKPFFDARLVNDTISRENVILEVHSQKINTKEFGSFKDNWERVCNRILKEIVKRPDAERILKQLIHEQ
jgi:hypothetical protein